MSRRFQAVPQNPASIAGRVVDATSGRPVEGAAVRLSSSARGQGVGGLQATTGSGGAFGFSDVPVGTYQILVTCPSYVDGALGQHVVLGSAQSVPIRSSQTIGGVVIRLWKYAAIAGRVNDARNAPIPRATVEAWRFVAGSSGFTPRSFHRISTDNVGGFRLPVLPGRYLVSASPNLQSQNSATSWRAFFPSVWLPAQATVIDVAGGEERNGIEIRVPELTQGLSSLAAKIQGWPSSMRGAQVSLLSLESSPLVPAGLEVARSAVAGDGSFLIPRIPTGVFRVRGVGFPAADRTRTSQQFGGLVRPRPNGSPVGALPDGQSWWFDTQVVVGEKPTEIAIVARPGSRIAGKLLFDSAIEQPSAENLSATPIAVFRSDAWDMSPVPVAGVHPDGAFQTIGLPDGFYLVGPESMFPGWHIQTISVNGNEVAGAGIQVLGADVGSVLLRLTRALGAVQGTVRDQAGLIGADCIVYVFTTDKRRWGLGLSQSVSEIQPDRSGAFQLSLRPGEYYVAAVTGNLPEDWSDPRFLETMAATAPKVTIVTTRKVTVDLKPQIIR